MKKNQIPPTSRQLQGLAASPGLAMGRALVLVNPHARGARRSGAPPEMDGGSLPQDEPVILVGHDFPPQDVLAMDRQLVRGFVMELGGVTGHSAIVARSVGIPAVMGCLGICQQVVSGDFLVVDGSRGRVVVNPDSKELAAYEKLQQQMLQDSRQTNLFAHLPAETREGRKMAIEANIQTLEEIELALQHGAAGIGLFRSEFYYLTPEGPPSEELLLAIYEHLLTSMSPMPVTVRTLDLGGGKEVEGHQIHQEKNPALGLKAIRLALREPQLFKTQLRALLRAAGFGTLRLIFPMITSLEELLAAKEMVTRVRKELRSQGLPAGDDVEIGMLVAVPGVVALADRLAREVDFFSIATNDLVQHLLAVDRDNHQVASLYNPLHPMVLRMIAQVVKAGHDAGIEVHLCGEMAADPHLLPLLLGLGLDGLSMSPPAMPAIKQMVRKSHCRQAEALAADLLACASPAAIQTRLADHHATSYHDQRAGDCGLAQKGEQ
ncbi:MAG: phosphoenolpyruvate--protein phosphotransferase [Desulfurivibrionaceae bacterium]|nr:phosphoenolpyruvate--protein phosphotransferase [Desulfurivibrionaceae bacterium]